MRSISLRCFLWLLSFALASPLSTRAASWREIPPAEFAAERSPVAPDAGAMILLREITIDNGDFDGVTQAFYVRIKVFDQKGIDALLQTQIPYERGQNLRGIAARVVRPDGTSIEVDKKSIFTREVVRVGREAVLAKSFSFPALEPGCIIEYQYRVYSDDILLGLHLPMSDDFPVSTTRIRLRTFGLPGLRVQVLWSSQLNMEKLEDRDRGFHVFEGHDIAPAAVEAFSPPDSVIKPWFTFYFTPSDGSATDFWSYEAGALAAAAKEQLAARRPIKEAAQRLTAGITDDRAKLQRLYDYCRTEIKNLSYDTCGYTPEQIEDLKRNRSPSDTLKNGYGTNLDINLLFGAMLNALGGKCILAYCGDRSLFHFHRNLRLRGALPQILVAMQQGGAWEFFDPGAMYLPCGQLRWMNDGTSAIVIEGKTWWFVEIPRTAPEFSTINRTAQLRLEEDGTLAGEIVIQMSGHDGIAAKHDFDAKTEDERREAIRTALVERLEQADLSDLVLEHVTDPDQPITIRYHVAVKGYAELTAGRMFLQPAFFQKGVPALFTASERKNDLFFPYQYQTTDTVTIDLPEGYEFEEPRAPSPVNVQNLLLYQPQLEYAKRTRRLIFTRKYSFFGEDYAARAYPPIKAGLDRVMGQDAHRLALRRANAEPVSEDGAAASSPEPALP